MVNTPRSGRTDECLRDRFQWPPVSMVCHLSLGRVKALPVSEGMRRKKWVVPPWSGEAGGCNVRRMLTALVRSPSVASVQMWVKTNRRCGGKWTRSVLKGPIRCMSGYIAGSICVCVACTVLFPSPKRLQTRPGEAGSASQEGRRNQWTKYGDTSGACLRDPHGWEVGSQPSPVSQGRATTQTIRQQTRCPKRDYRVGRSRYRVVVATGVKYH